MNAMQAIRLAYRSEQHDAILRAHIRAVNKRIRKAASMGETFLNFSFDFEQYPLDLKGQDELKRVFQKKGFIVSIYETDLDTGLTIIFRDNLRPANLDGCETMIPGIDLHEGDIVNQDGLIYEVKELDEGCNPDRQVYLGELRRCPKCHEIPMKNLFYLVAVYMYPHLK